ncbi:S1C family serine protease [Ornithinibacillus halophilus]|uniref:Trypsin-like peptidase domain-containing protein n=1 Tax=Ornithinibacillus halophilus TaxID=930117 RepID=A0A1M5I8Y7_9BACI|nr:S1C family serine protease [Ornithinibacillus halophilus]SHG24687.1 Trypsin-like peptidase domain-containing protein [Ornithinibacillus halophilus]
MKKKRNLPIIITILISVIGFIFIGYLYWSWHMEDLAINKPELQQVNEEKQTLTLKNIIHENEKFVVQIEAQSEYNTSTGSGFLYNQKGDIITNAHVIRDSEIITVRTANARIYPAAVIGIDKKTDIAVIRVPQLAGEKGLEMEREKPSEIGDEVIALGSPHGFQNTVTLGIISGTERNFSVEGYDYENAYQISAQITHGNSGGPLLNRESGKVIGINSVGTEDGTLGFSIPIADVLDQVEKWSNEARNDLLDFTSMDDLVNTINPDQFMQDSAYLIEYFFDSILIRDYVGAYALLGDSIQTTTTYSDFRKGYIQIINLDYTILSEEVTEDNNLITTVEVTIDTKLPNEEETKKVELIYTLTVAYENEQLKIIEMDIQE